MNLVNLNNKKMCHVGEMHLAVHVKHMRKGKEVFFLGRISNSYFLPVEVVMYKLPTCIILIGIVKKYDGFFTQ